MKLFWISLLSPVLWGHAAAQELIFEESVPDTITQNDYGPNSRHFVFLELGGGLFVGPSDNEMPTNQWRNWGFQLGLSYKYKLNGLLSVGARLHYMFSSYSIQQTASKRLPTPRLFDSERLNLSDLSPSGFVRLNFKPSRGASIGSYVDLGGGVCGTIGAGHQYEYEDIASGETVHVRRTDLGYVRRLAPFISARVGYEWFGWYGRFLVAERFSFNGNRVEQPNILIGFFVSTN